jgi:taurine dioxygenase
MSTLTEDKVVPFPGLTILTFDSGLSMDEFRELLGEVIVELYVDRDLALSASYNTSHRTPDTPRDHWSPDHYWHSDRSYSPKRPFATVLYGSIIEGQVAGTDFIDTKELLKYIAKDDPELFAQIVELSGVFAWSSYFDQTIVRAGQPAIDRAKQINGTQCISTIANVRALQYPASTHPLIQPHPEDNKDTLYFDERVVRLEGIPRVLDIEIQAKLRAYLELDGDELANRPYFYHHDWEPGQMVLFTNTGTLHRAVSGNEGTRTLHRSLVNNQCR